MVVRRPRSLLMDLAYCSLNEPESHIKGFGVFVGGCGAFRDTSDPMEAIKMEVQFDIGCEFEPKFFTCTYQISQTPVITLFFYGAVKGTPKIGHPEYVSECKWFKMKEMTGVELGFDHKEILKKFLVAKTKA